MNYSFNVATRSLPSKNCKIALFSKIQELNVRTAVLKPSALPIVLIANFSIIYLLYLILQLITFRFHSMCCDLTPLFSLQSQTMAYRGCNRYQVTEKHNMADKHKPKILFPFLKHTSRSRPKFL